MSKQTTETDVAFISALAELLNKNELTELSVKREYGEDDSLEVRVVKQATEAIRHELAERLKELEAEGKLLERQRTALRAIASELIAPKIKTRRGGEWQVSNVKQVLEIPHPYIWGIELHILFCCI